VQLFRTTMHYYLSGMDSSVWPNPSFQRTAFGVR
jgi:hypothetical protein